MKGSPSKREALYMAGRLPEKSDGNGKIRQTDRRGPKKQKEVKSFRLFITGLFFLYLVGRPGHGALRIERYHPQLFLEQIQIEVLSAHP